MIVLLVIYLSRRQFKIPCRAKARSKKETVSFLKKSRLIVSLIYYEFILKMRKAV